MYYKDYIKLGFKRIEMNDSVEFDQTGYYGFCLSKKINKKMFIELCAGELDSPKLYIKKLKGDQNYHILNITPECVVDLCAKDNPDN